MAWSLLPLSRSKYRSPKRICHSHAGTGESAGGARSGRVAAPVSMAKSKVAEHGIIHVQGKQKGDGGEDVDVDQTVTLEDFKVASESKRM